MYKFMHNSITLRLYIKASDVNNDEHSYKISHYDLCIQSKEVYIKYINEHQQNNCFIKVDSEYHN